MAQRPFLGSAAVAAALLTRRQLQSPVWRRLFRDVYVHRDVPLAQPVRVQAATLLLPTYAVLSGTSAAWVQGPDVLREGEPADASVQLRVKSWKTRHGLRVHRTVLDPEADAMTVHGLPVTTATRTLFDVARREPLGAAVAVADAMLHARLVDPEQVLAYAGERSRWPGAALVPVVLAHADPAAESVRESRLRLLLVLGGLPRPVAQFEVRDEHADVVARLDLAYPECKLAIEYDGEYHFTKEQALADLRRQNRLRALGWTILRFTHEDLVKRPQQVVAQVRAALSA